jgi:hypothetical protein
MENMVDLVSHCRGDSCDELVIFKMKFKLGDYRRSAPLAPERLPGHHQERLM